MPSTCTAEPREVPMNLLVDRAAYLMYLSPNRESGNSPGLGIRIGEIDMRIAQNKPKEVKSAVYVTKDRYELWHSRPVLLGVINKTGGYWYSQDGMRFISSRDALEYMIKLRDARQGGTSTPEKLIPPTVPRPSPVLRRAAKKLGPTQTQDPRTAAQALWPEFLKLVEKHGAGDLYTSAKKEE